MLRQDQPLPELCCSHIKSATIGVVVMCPAMLSLLSIILLKNDNGDPPYFLLVIYAGNLTALFAYTWNVRDFVKEFLSQQWARCSTIREGGRGQVNPAIEAIQLPTLNTNFNSQNISLSDGGVYVG